MIDGTPCIARFSALLVQKMSVNMEIFPPLAHRKCWIFGLGGWFVRDGVDMLGKC